jgi:hypothetical protein
MTFPEEKPSNPLGYRPAHSELRGPTVWHVFGGTAFAMLGIPPLGAGILFVWLAALSFRAFAFRINPASSPPPSMMLGLMPAALCFFASFVMFRLSYRLFRGRCKPSE